MLKFAPMYSVLVLILCLFSYGGQNQSKPATHKKKSTPSVQSTPVPIASVQPLPTPQRQEKPAEKQQTATDDSGSWFKPEWWMVALTSIYVVLTGAYVWFSGRTLSAILRQEKDSATQFSEQMIEVRKSADAATKSAAAMGNIVTVIQDGNRKILRAYLTVLSPEIAIFQERREGLPDLKFEARPRLFNGGNTPARNVHMRTNGGILPHAVPEAFSFPLPEEGIKDAGLIGARVSYNMPITLINFVPDRDVPSIKEGDGKVFVVWGLITYEDIFGDSHFTRFAQIVRWNPDRTLDVYYLPGQNDAD